ncbi:12830_t:CDS:2 [Cetraspora pellucida]|uniref:12830_t:CDS:1 n=1 Tax=Cetraspora pellucida TaxID=1433469 RepID=A0ACA9M290_9GLOM|nr:12830_t:CDS:2 [Cetraspora pellucida]
MSTELAFCRAKAYTNIACIYVPIFLQPNSILEAHTLLWLYRAHYCTALQPSRGHFSLIIPRLENTLAEATP